MMRLHDFCILNEKTVMRTRAIFSVALGNSFNGSLTRFIKQIGGNKHRDTEIETNRDGVMLVLVLNGLYILNGELTHKNVIHLFGLRNRSQRESDDTFRD